MQVRQMWTPLAFFCISVPAIQFPVSLMGSVFCFLFPAEAADLPLLSRVFF